MILWWLSLYQLFIKQFDLFFQSRFHFLMKKHFSILTCLELILKGFSNPALLMSCPQGPLGSWKFDFLNFSSPWFRASCPQGPFRSWKFYFLFFKPGNCVFWLMEAPRSALEAPRSLLGSLGMEFRLAINFDCENWGLFATISLKCKFNCVFLRGGVRILQKTEVKMRRGSVTVSQDLSRALYQHRENPYS